MTLNLDGAYHQDTDMSHDDKYQLFENVNRERDWEQGCVCFGTSTGSQHNADIAWFVWFVEQQKPIKHFLFRPQHNKLKPSWLRRTAGLGNKTCTGQSTRSKLNPCDPYFGKCVFNKQAFQQTKAKENGCVNPQTDTTRTMLSGLRKALCTNTSLTILSR